MEAFENDKIWERGSRLPKNHCEEVLSLELSPKLCVYLKPAKQNISFWQSNILFDPKVRWIWWLVTAWQRNFSWVKIGPISADCLCVKLCPTLWWGGGASWQWLLEVNPRSGTIFVEELVRFWLWVLVLKFRSQWNEYLTRQKGKIKVLHHHALSDKMGMNKGRVKISSLITCDGQSPPPQTIPTPRYPYQPPPHTPKYINAGCLGRRLLGYCNF